MISSTELSVLRKVGSYWEETLHWNVEEFRSPSKVKRWRNLDPTGNLNETSCLTPLSVWPFPDFESRVPGTRKTDQGEPYDGTWTVYSFIRSDNLHSPTNLLLAPQGRLSDVRDWSRRSYSRGGDLNTSTKEPWIYILNCKLGLLK